MMRRTLTIAMLVCLVPVLPAGADQQALPAEAGYGPDPTLPQPEKHLIPTIKIAPAIGWAVGEMPIPAAGFTVNAYATGLDHPRWLYVLPNGDVLIVETNGPPRPDDRKGIKGWFMKRAMRKAGAGMPSRNRITLARDADGDGRAEMQTVFLEGLNSPFGVTLVGDKLYVANTDRLLRFLYNKGDTRIRGPGETVTELPAGSINHHWTKNVTANPDGSRLYVTVGSNSNAAENGMQNEMLRAAILEIDPVTGEVHPYASGLRNPNGLAWQPESGALWTVVNERDELGNDLVPDYLTAVAQGGFYGWPYSYYGQNVDTRVQPQDAKLVSQAIRPDYALGSHTASLGLVFYQGTLFPAHYAGGAFVGQHGSWNRNPPSGYKVIFVPFANGVPAGTPEDFVTGFRNDEGQARGRPVGVAVDRTGALLIADDVGNVVWRVTPLRTATSH